MKGTRAEIVSVLRRTGECTVAELARQVGINHTALRRHLEILAAEGTVEYRAVRQAAGRPYFRYRLTEQAHEAGSTGYPRLLERLVVEMSALDRAETRAKDGQGILDLVFGHMAEHMVAQYKDRIHGESMEERVRSLTDALREEGILDRWDTRDGDFHLSTNACPHRRAAMAAHGICEAEARTIATLLGTEVQQVTRLVDGASCCEYVVKGDARPGNSTYISLLNSATS